MRRHNRNKHLYSHYIANSDSNPEFTDETFSKDVPVQKIYDFFYKLFNYIIGFTIFLFKIYGIYFLWICLHYFSAHLYIKFCVPNTITGFIMSPFMISTPHCQGLRWIVYSAAGIINNMWIVLGTWIYSLIWVFNKEN